MAKKHIGIDIGQHSVRVVIATLVKGMPIFTSASEQPAVTAEDRSRALVEMLGEVAFGDRVATSLDAVGSYFRLLQFPFGQAKKIEPAVSLEMSTQLPTSEALVCDFLAPRPNGHVFEVPAAAVKRRAVTDMLEVFQQAGHPLHLLDLNPFVYAAGLAETIPEGILGVVLAREVTVAHVRAGQVVSFRTMPRRQQDSTEHLAAMIQREYRTLMKIEDKPPELFLIGEGADSALLKALQGIGLAPQYPALKIDGQQVDPAMLPAAILALRAALPGRIRQFNFLKGDLAPTNEWVGFRLRLIAIGALLGFTIIMAACGAYLKYEHQQKRAEMLRAETIAIFRQTFPQVQTIVDVPNQMRSNLAEMREKARLLGVGQSRTVLNVLREISARIPTEISIDVREIIYSGNELHIDGSTSSFDAINRLSQALDASPLFEQTQVTDAKMGLDEGRVDFRLNTQNSAEELSQ